MKKNIILALSLILSSVATLNLASCSDDDDDDANHAPKSVVVDNNQNNNQKQNNSQSTDQQTNQNTNQDSKQDTKQVVKNTSADFACTGVVIVMNRADFTEENVGKVGNIFKTYFENSLGGLTDGVSMDVKSGFGACSFTLKISAKAGQVENIANKLQEMNNDQTALTKQLETFPILHTLGVSIRQQGQTTTLFRCHYVSPELLAKKGA